MKTLISIYAVTIGFSTGAFAFQARVGTGACANVYLYPSSPITIETKIYDGFPTGSADEMAWLDAIGRWNQNPSNGYFDSYGTVGTPAKFNGINEAWKTSNNSLLLGNAAVTWSDINLSTCTVDEVDIVFTNATGWSTQEDPVDHPPWVGGSRNLTGAALHELGHAAGLLEENRYYNIMGDMDDYGTRNGSRVFRSFGEDAAVGLQFLYGLYNLPVLQDAGVSPFGYVGQNGNYSDHAFLKVKDGFGHALSTTSNSGGMPVYNMTSSTGNIQAEFTLENMGPAFYYPTLSWRLYLSTDNIITSSDTVIGSGSEYVSLNVPSTYTMNGSISSPLTPNQIYYVGIVINWTNYYADAEPLNNVAYHQIKYVP